MTTMSTEEKKTAEAAQAVVSAETLKEKADADSDGLSPEEKQVKESAENLDKNKIDYEAELKKEREARAKAELKLADDRAREANRKRKVQEEEGVEDDDDAPLTKKDLVKLRSEISSETRREIQVEQAFSIAKGMAGSDVEAELIVAKWKNRSFPEDLPLSDQIEEAYAITHRKKLIGERDEAFRALKGKDGVNRNPAGSYREPAGGVISTTSAQDSEAFKAAGFSWNSTSRNWEKKLPNGELLIRDSKTKATRLVKKSK